MKPVFFALPKQTATSVPPLYQIILIIITSISVASMFYSRLSLPVIRDPLPNFDLINPESFRQFGSFSTEINVGLYIDEYENFNLSDNNFVFTGEVWFQFDPGTVSLATIEKFSFAFGEILEKSAPRTALIHNKMVVRYNVRVRHVSTLALQDFPLDNHTIYIELQNQYISPSEILFNVQYRNFIATSNSEIYGWNQVDTLAKAGYHTDKIDQYDSSKTSYYPIALFLIEYTRSSIQQVVTIFLPLLLIFFVMLFCFSIEKASTSISLSAGSVTGILAYRFVIANISPKVGYFMLSDYIFFLFLALATLVFFLNISDVCYHNFRIFSKKIIVFIIHCIVNLSIWFLLFC